jgi:hypothetical protein
MLIIEEIGIVSSKLLHSINMQFNVMKDLNCDSTAVFGSLHVVIAPRGFHQFTPLYSSTAMRSF